MSKKLLAIDQSLRCTAWCIFEGDNLESLTSFGCIKTSKNDGDLFTRVSIISSQLEKLSKQDITHLCREGLSFGGVGNATRDLAYLVGAVEATVGEPFAEVSPTSVKKFATGSGRADKGGMIAALPSSISEWFISKNYKKTTGLADLADAYFIGQYFIDKLRNSV